MRARESRALKLGDPRRSERRCAIGPCFAAKKSFSEKGPQGSGTKAVSICVAWTHRGVERYAGVFPCFRRSKKHPQTSVVYPKWIFGSRLPNLATHEITQEINNIHYLKNIQ